ncbi:MAG: DNA repair protein RecN [Clostridia bacterium]|nr:DNA repair protein RecN [Clostridia bacterium]
MIQSLSVENIALIEKLQVELGIGLNILSGETGAGKSIIIDAVSFVLGERADRSLIRYGTDFAVVEAVFSDYLTPAVKEYLDEIGIEDEEVLILNRKMTVEGKNSCRINGRVTTLSTLKGLTELLVDIHGQHEHQSLLNPNNHVGLLDGLGGEKHMKLLDRVKEAYKNYTSLKREFSLFGDEDERVRRLDILAYQIAEIEKGDVQEGEEDELLDKRKRIRNVERILEALTNAKNLLDGYDSTAVSPELKTTISTLNMISQYDNRIDGLNERLEDARAEIIDVADTVKSILDELDFDRHSADQVEERLELVRMLQRKYGGSFDALTKFYEKAVEERDRLENAGDRVAKLEGELKKAVKDLTSACEDLTESRRKIADKFEKSIIKELGDLGMGGSTFTVKIDSAVEAEDFTSNGADKVEFLISPNVGEPLKPLAKIISGGEMSRFMLALKNILADIDHIGTMIFDEIDTGISGNISAVVSEKMCNISRKRQVIAVTHMPSLAAMADSHFLIAKSTENGKTHTHLDLLEDDTEEVARLIGGKDYSSHAIPHAKEMKAWAERYKASL